MATYKDGTRDCTICRKRLPLEEFWWSSRAKNERQYRCKTCHGATLREWVSLNKDKKAEYNRRYWYTKGYLQQAKRNYGLAPEDIGRMLHEQAELCAICREPEHMVVRGRSRPLHIDHDHATGKIRGLLCSGCNTGLGKFGDDPEILEAAAAYLRRLPATD